MIALAKIVGVVLTFGVWFWLGSQDLSPTASLAVAAAGTLVPVPIILAGRWALDQQPELPRAVLVTTVVHHLVAICLGSALLEATLFSLHASPWPLPLPPWLGLTLMIVSGAILALVVVNLTLKGLGLPFALALTRVLTTEWIYAWTRNPMVLSALAFLVGLGLWLKSALFLIWLLVLVSPVMWLFLTVYEERELEIRFGQAYRDYRARTPWLIPRRPARGDDSSSLEAPGAPQGRPHQRKKR